MSERLVARLVWAVAALAFVGIGFMTWSVYRAGEFGSTVLSALAGSALVVALCAFVLSGAMSVSRQPRNVIGWLLIIPGLSVPLTELGNVWLRNLDPAPVRADIWLWLALWITSWAWVLLIFPVFHLLLTFPNGRLLSPRWRWVVWLEVAMVATMMGMSALGSEMSLVVGEETVSSVANPIGLAALTTEFSDEGGVFESVWSFSLLLVTLTCLSAVVIRFRRGPSEEREQLKWPIYAVALFGLVYASAAIGMGLEDGGVPELLFGLSLAGIPVAVAVAVLRYRLYEIDRIISRTVSYVIVVGLLGAVFFGVVTALSSVLQAESQLAVAGSTLAVAALFNPVRKRVQGWVDRRFNRSRYDAQRVMDRFSGSLRDQVDSTRVVEGWVGVVAETMQPATVAVWVRDSSWDDRDDGGEDPGECGHRSYGRERVGPQLVTYHSRAPHGPPSSIDRTGPRDVRIGPPADRCQLELPTARLPGAAGESYGSRRAQDRAPPRDEHTGSAMQAPGWAYHRIWLKTPFLARCGAPTARYGSAIAETRPTTPPIAVTRNGFGTLAHDTRQHGPAHETTQS